MAFTSPNMGLRIWNLITDAFSHTDLFNNFAVLDAHNHTSGYGVQIPAGGLAPGSVTAAALANGAVTPAAMSFPAYVSLAVNGSAAPGQCIVAAGGITVSLPAANAASSTPINIVAGSTASGSSPVTVSATGGATILGQGLSNTATSFLLGTPGAYATLVAGGGRWVMVDGAQDTGWVSLAPQPGYVIADTGAYTGSARLVADWVQLSGVVVDTVGGSITWVQVATIPAGLRPAQSVGGMATALAWASGAAGNSYTYGEWFITPAGALYYSSNTGHDYAIMLDGLSYRLV